MNMKVIIIGGVAGGATCATRLRRLNEKIDITIYEKSGYVSYANCGLPYYLGNIIKDKNKLTLQTPKSFKERFNVDVFVNHEVLKVDIKNKEVIVKDLINNKIFNDKYDKLVISTGAKPIIPNIEGKELGLCLKNVEDTFKIEKYLKEKKVKKALVVGAGFIGLEVVDNLCHLGIDVTLVEMQNQVLTPLDIEMSSFIKNELIANNIKLLLNKTLNSLKEENGAIKAIFNNCEDYFDLVVFALGVSPETSFLKDSGLKLGLKDGIVVNDKLETNICDIYACGDAVIINNLINNKDSLISLAGPANKQARIIADNIYGLNSIYKGGIGTSILKIFNLNCAFVGLNEKYLKNNNIKYNKIYLSPNNHASYYPNSHPLIIKILFNLEYEILGAQVIGKDMVDKTIDILALAIYKKINLLELQDIDFAYAPPFNSAKAPINMASYIASNIRLGLVKQYDIFDVEKLIKEKDVILLDVRTKEEYERGHIKNYINIPLDDLRCNLSSLDKTKKIYVMCQSALRSYLACRILANLGYDCANLAGGYLIYSSYYLNQKANNLVLPCGKEII